VAFTIVRCAMIPFLMRFGDPLRTLAAIVALTSVGEALILRFVVTVFTPLVRFRFVAPMRHELAVLYGFGIKSFFLLLAVKIISYTDTTVIGLAVGSAAVALYVLPLQLVEYGRIVVNGISTVLLPELAATGDGGGHFRSTYLYSSRIAAMLAVFINVTIIFVGAPFLTLWVGEPFGRAAPPILLCLGAAGIAQALTTQVSVPFYQATGKLGFPVTVLLLEAVANLALSIWLVKPFGIAGVAVATVIPSFAITAAVLPPYLAKVVGVSLRRWLGYAIAPAIGLLVVLVGAYSILTFLLPRTSYVTISANVGIGAAVTVVVAWRLFGVRVWRTNRSEEEVIASAISEARSEVHMTAAQRAQIQSYRNLASEYDSVRFVGPVNDLKESFRRRAILGLLPDKRSYALDVACGTGRGLLLLNKRAAKTFGVDGTREMLREAAQRLEEQGESPSVCQGNAAELPFANSTFDLVTCLNFLHLFDDASDKRAFIAEIARVLKPGGVAVIEFDNALHGLVLGPVRKYLGRDIGYEWPWALSGYLGAELQMTTVRGTNIPFVWRIPFLRALERLSQIFPTSYIASRLLVRAVRVNPAPAR
jgi:ubiquinone/menaquinone biosynthesis C-methylase UbiE